MPVKLIYKGWGRGREKGRGGRREREGRSCRFANITLVNSSCLFMFNRVCGLYIF